MTDQDFRALCVALTGKNYEQIWLEAAQRAYEHKANLPWEHANKFVLGLKAEYEARYEVLLG
jgi:hypothetical protein